MRSAIRNSAQNLGSGNVGTAVGGRSLIIDPPVSLTQIEREI